MAVEGSFLKGSTSVQALINLELEQLSTEAEDCVPPAEKDRGQYQFWPAERETRERSSRSFEPLSPDCASVSQTHIHKLPRLNPKPQR